MPSLTPQTERRALQVAVAILSLVPVLGGAAGIALGARVFGADVHALSGDSHVRYLSGLLFGIGLAFWATVPSIERQGPRFRLLAGLVLIGGLGRLAALAIAGSPGRIMVLALGMEIVVTPLLALWRERVGRRSGMALPRADASSR